MPGENYCKILSPIVKDDSTSIEIRFDYDLVPIEEDLE